jgi:hypothetical protein
VLKNRAAHSNAAGVLKVDAGRQAKRAPRYLISALFAYQNASCVNWPAAVKKVPKI